MINKYYILNIDVINCKIKLINFFLGFFNKMIYQNKIIFVSKFIIFNWIIVILKVFNSFQKTT